MTDDKRWSPDQLAAYELAADLSGQLTALSSAWVFRAEQGEAPARAEVERVHDEAAEVHRRFRALDPADSVAVAAFNADCQRRIERFRASS